MEQINKPTIDEEIERLETRIRDLKAKAITLPSGSLVRGNVYRAQLMLEKDLQELKKQKKL